MGRTTGGFLIGFGMCLLLLGLGPICLAEVARVLKEMPDSPSSRAMRTFASLLKGNPYAYAAARRFYEVSLTFYEVMSTVWEVRLFHIYSSIIGTVMILKGLLSFRSKGQDEDAKIEIKGTT